MKVRSLSATLQARLDELIRHLPPGELPGVLEDGIVIQLVGQKVSLKLLSDGSFYALQGDEVFRIRNVPGVDLHAGVVFHDGQVVWEGVG